MKQEYKKYGIVTIIISLTILSILYIANNKSHEYEITTSEITEEEMKMETEAVDIQDKENIEIVDIIEKIPIYVCGEVNKPDVYYLDERTIVKEAIIAAGGFTDDADQEAWNLAMEIQKGEKIDVPKVGEEIDKTGNSYDNRVGGDSLSNTGTKLININTANAQELTALSGIGPTIAQNIIEYRDINGEFKTLEDVTNVSRIGKVTLEKIKDYICFQ